MLHDDELHEIIHQAQSDVKLIIEWMYRITCLLLFASLSVLSFVLKNLTKRFELRRTPKYSRRVLVTVLHSHFSESTADNS